MIKLFNKIRQRLLTENKFSKYLLYAIGEIVLVVVGILIALNINNWNEGRKATKQEIKILSELKSDLETNLEELKETYNVTNSRQQYANLILDHFEKASPVNDSLKKAFEHINMDGLFNIANTAYKFIENQGVNTLSNDSLRIRVTVMYERYFKNIVTRETKNWEIVDDELLPLMNEYFKTSPSIDKKVSFSLITLNEPINIEQLRNNNKFKNMIFRLQTWLLIRLKWQQETHIELEKLIIDVQEEIDRLSA